MRHYTLAINLLDGSKLTGIAQTTKVYNKKEFLLIKANGKEQEIRLDRIKSISVQDDKAEFKTIIINESNIS